VCFKNDGKLAFSRTVIFYSPYAPFYSHALSLKPFRLRRQIEKLQIRVKTRPHIKIHLALLRSGSAQAEFFHRSDVSVTSIWVTRDEVSYPVISDSVRLCRGGIKKHQNEIGDYGDTVGTNTLSLC
jgi:hypothetical protein